MLQNVPVYLLAQFAVLRVARSNRAGCASNTNLLHKSNSLQINKLCHFFAISMSERTGMSVNQVTDEVLYTGLVVMQEMDEL